MPTYSESHDLDLPLPSPAILGLALNHSWTIVICTTSLSMHHLRVPVFVGMRLGRE